MSKEQNMFTPLEWLNLWYMAQEREQDYQEHLLERKRRLHTKLISAQDEKFRESRLRAEKLEQKRRRQVLDKRKKIGDYYTEYIKNHLRESHDEEEEPRYYVTEWHTHAHAASRAKTRSPRKRKEEVEEPEDVDPEEENTEEDGEEIFRIPPVSHEQVIHWDQGDVLAYSKYTNIITNKALPDHIKSILTRTFGPFLANYYINPHAPAIRIQEEPRVRLGELAANGYGARHLWRKMRSESNKALLESEMARPPDLKKAFRVYVEDPRLIEYNAKRTAEKRMSKDTSLFLKNEDGDTALEPPVHSSNDTEVLPNRSLNLSKRLSELDEDKSSLLLFNNSAVQNSPAQIDSKPSAFVTHLGILREDDDELEKERSNAHSNANRKASCGMKDWEKEEASKAELSAQFKIKFLTDEESGRQGAPEFSKRYAYVPEVNPVKHVKTEASSREAQIGTSQLPARIDLSRPQGVERAPTMDTENNSLFVSRDNTFVTPRTRDHANTAPVSASAANLSSDAKLKQPSAPRGKEVGSSKNKAHITTGTVAEINSPKKQTEESWQPLSLPALSGYLPVGTGRVSGDGINYIKTQH